MSASDACADNVHPQSPEMSEANLREANMRTEVLDITVLMGGPGSEREVSLMSGRAVADALKLSGHRVTTADISPDDTSALDREGIDVVFIALHGTFGEDGQVQRLCEQRGLVYVGSGPAASELTMDKDASKRFFRRVGLATPEWVIINRSAKSDFPPPCVVKPVSGGSSVDVTIARDEATRDAALKNLLTTDSGAMIEAFIPGKEMTVSVLADKPLPVIEIRTAREFYDYIAKYNDDATQYIFDTQLPPAIEQHLQAVALTAHKALGCKDFSRADFILDDDATVWLLEVNTIPGFTSHSLLPKAAAAAGISFEQLCDRIVRLAMERAGE